MSSPTKSCEHFNWCATAVSERTLQTFCLPFALCGNQASNKALIRGLSRQRLATTCCSSPPIANAQTTHPSSYLHTSLAKWIHFHFPHVGSKGSIRVKCLMKSQLDAWLVIVKFAAARVGGRRFSRHRPPSPLIFTWLIKFWIFLPSLPFNSPSLQGTPAENWPEDIWSRPPR